MSVIREPEAGDRDEWLRMRRILWDDCPEEEHYADIAAYLAHGEGSLPESCGYSSGGIAAFVAARSEGGLCGFVEAAIRSYAEGVEPGAVGYIEGWYVDPDVRRTGVGRALIDAAEAWARAKGCRRMGSDALVGNDVSVAAHGRLGYRELVRLVHFGKDLD